MTTPSSPPEAVLLDRRRRQNDPPLSVEEAAKLSGISEGRWRQVVKGFTTSAGKVLATSARDTTLARMAAAVGATPEELREAGREDAAEILARSLAGSTGGEWDGDLTTVPHRELLAELERRLDEQVYADHRVRQASVSNLASRRKTTPGVSPATYRDGMPEDAVADSSDEVGGTPDDFEP